MTLPRSEKQKMYYSQPDVEMPVYVMDKGEIVYVKMPDGKQEPMKSGETKIGYSTPVEFYNSITSDLTADEITAFGADGNISAKMTYRNGEYPFKVGTLIWHRSEPTFKDGYVDKNSADYIVKGVKEAGVALWKCLLKEVVK